MANTLAFATILQTKLDELTVREMLTGYMDSNAGQVKYTGGNEVKIPKMSVTGLRNYHRETGDGAGGYQTGAVDLSYETRQMTQDRGLKFFLDSQDVDETNFIATATTIMGKFQKEQVVSEIDAFRLAKVAQTAIEAGNVEYGYTPSSTDIITKIKTGIKEIRKAGYNSELVIHISADALMQVEIAALGKLTAVTFSSGGIDTQVPSIDGVPLLITPDNRLYSKIDILDNATGGYQKSSTKGLDCNFIIVTKRTPLAITKQDKMRIFTPDQNQQADAWSMDYRRYHDLWVLDNQTKSLYVNIKDNEPA